MNELFSPAGLALQVLYVQKPIPFSKLGGFPTKEGSESKLDCITFQKTHFCRIRDGGGAWVFH